MKWIAKYVTGRVIAWLIIAILAGYFSIGRAEAGCTGSAGSYNCTDEGEAYMKIANHPKPTPQCNGYFNYSFQIAPRKVGNQWNAQIKCFDNAVGGGPSYVSVFANYPSGQSCAARPASTGTCNASKSGHCTSVCFGGCLETITLNVPPDDILVTEGPEEGRGLWRRGVWHPTGATCKEGEGDEDGPEECPVGQKRLPDGTCAKQGDCPVGMHVVAATGSCAPDGACPTGQQKAPDGSCVAESCPTGFAKKKNGTCGLDENGDGVPDEEDPGNEDGNKASGGEACTQPPVCSGDAIMCLQTKIQWRIDCNTRKQATVSGGACGNPPICTGDGCKATEYASLMLQWRTACALEAGSGGGGPSMAGVETRLDRIGNFLDGNGQGVPEAPDMPFDETEGESEEWSSGLPTSGACPAPISTTISFMSVNAPLNFEFTGICEFSVKLKTLVVMLGYLSGLLIIVGLRR